MTVGQQMGERQIWEQLKEEKEKNLEGKWK
jgi:hypothetical protein